MGVVDANRVAEDVLDAVMGVEKKFFPLDLSVHYPKLRDLWYQSGRLYWDPRRDIPWDQFDPSRYTADELDAGRHFWSHRTWVEYQGMFTTTAELLGYALDGLKDFDHKLYLAMKILEEGRHVEVSYLFAEKLGGHVQAPSSQGFGKRIDYQLANRTIEGRVLPECDVIHHWSGEMIAVELFKGRYASATDPIAKAICKYILQDEARHIQSALIYLAERVPGLTLEERKVVERALVWQIENVELKGLHSIGRIPGEHVKKERESFSLAKKAGLGGETPEEQDECLRRAIIKMRATVAPWGLAVPKYTELGEAA